MGRSAYDFLFLILIGAGLGVHLYWAGRAIGLTRRARLYMLLSLGTWACPLLLWFWLALKGVHYDYETTIDVSFSGFLYPLYVCALIRDELNFKIFPLLLLGLVFIFSGASYLSSAMVRRDALLCQGSKRDRELTHTNASS